MVATNHRQPLCSSWNLPGRRQTNPDNQQKKKCCCHFYATKFLKNFTCKGLSSFPSSSFRFTLPFSFTCGMKTEGRNCFFSCASKRTRGEGWKVCFHYKFKKGSNRGIFFFNIPLSGQFSRAKLHFNPRVFLPSFPLLPLLPLRSSFHSTFTPLLSFPVRLLHASPSLFIVFPSTLHLLSLPSSWFLFISIVFPFALHFSPLHSSTLLNTKTRGLSHEVSPTIQLLEGDQGPMGLLHFQSNF